MSNKKRLPANKFQIIFSKECNDRKFDATEEGFWERHDHLLELLGKEEEIAREHNNETTARDKEMNDQIKADKLNQKIQKRKNKKTFMELVKTIHTVCEWEYVESAVLNLQRRIGTYKPPKHNKDITHYAKKKTSLHIINWTFDNLFESRGTCLTLQRDLLYDDLVNVCKTSPTRAEIILQILNKV